MDQAHQDTDKTIAQLERHIREVYAEAQKDIQAKMEDYTRKFEAKDDIYRKKLAHGEITVDQYKQWLDGQVFQGEQWESKLNQISYTLTHSDEVAQKLINGQIYGVFSNNANWQLYGLCMEANLDFGFGLYDPATVARLLRENPNLLPAYRLNIPKDMAWNQSLVTRQITQGIIQGEGIQKIAKRIEKVTDQDKNLSLTRARTAMTGAQNAGRQESLNRVSEMGIKTKKVWLATLDGHTRTSHRELDGQEVPVNQPFRLDGATIAYPGDPHAHPAMVYNCRCTMVGRLVMYPDKYDDNPQRYDNIAGKPIKDMTYEQWLKAKKKEEEKFSINPIQASIGQAKSVDEVNLIMNSHEWFKLYKATTGWRAHPEYRSQADLTGCDLECAKSIASSYERMFDRYPQLIGKLDAVDAHPVGMNDYTYAWCYITSGGKVEVNPLQFNNFNKLMKEYEHDVAVGWHPKGTTAESIVIHELGHAVDGLITGAGIKGGRNSAGEFRYASSLMRNQVMKKCGLKVSDTEWAVSEYGAKNPQEWFAECFAEYLTSANPRPVATEFGKQLEELLKELK